MFQVLRYDLAGGLWTVDGELRIILFHVESQRVSKDNGNKLLEKLETLLGDATGEVLDL